MTDLRAQYNLAQEEVRQLSDALREYTAENGTATGGAQELAYMLAEAQGKADQAKESIRQLAGSEGEVGDNAGNALNPVSALGDMIMDKLAGAATVGGVLKLADAVRQLVEDTVEYGDNVDKMSQKMGISIEAYQEWDAILQRNGSSMNSISTSFKTLALAAQNASDEQVAAFERVGLSLAEVEEMSQEDLFAAVISGLQGMEEGALRTETATELLGRGAKELGPLLNMTAEETQEMRDRIYDLGGIMSKEAVEDAAEYKNAVEDLKTAWGGFVREATSDWIPILTDLANGLADGLAGLHNTEWTFDEYGQLTPVLKTTTAYSERVAEGLNSAAEASEKFAGKQKEVAAAAQDVVPELTEEEQAFKDATASMAEIGLAAYDAISSGADLGEVYAKLSGEMANLAGAGDPAIEAIANQRLAVLELAATVQDLAELPGYMTDTNYSLTELAGNLIATGSSASEFAAGVEALRDSVVNDFELMSEKTQISAAEMSDAIRQNKEQQQQWSADMHTLWAGAYGENDRIVREYIGHLAELGPEYAAAIHEMANGGIDELLSQAQDWYDIGVQSGQDYADGVALNAYLSGESGTDVSEAGKDAADAVDYTEAGQNKSGELASGMTGMGQVVTTAAESVAQNAMNAADGVDFSDVGKSAMQDVVSGIISGRGTVATSATSAMENAKAQAGAVNFASVGLNLARGIASGITSGTGFIQSAAISAVNAAKAAAEAAAGIHSPSTVWRDEVGAMLTKGMAAGMVTSEAMSALEDAATEIMKAGVDQAQVAVKAWEQVYRSFYDTQEHELFMMKHHGASNTDIISWYKSMQQAVHEQAEHYRAMGVEENSKYIMDLEEQWWEYQDEIDDIYEEMGVAAGKTAKKIEEDFQKAYNEIMQAQEKMASKLASFDLWTTDKNGNSILADPREQIRLLQEYDRALSDMSKYVGDNLMNEVLSMSTQQAVDFWHQLQQFGGEELNRYLTAYNKTIEMSQDIAEKYYANDVAALTEQYNKDMSGLQTEEYAQAQTAVLTRISEQNAESISALNRIAESIQNGDTEIHFDVDGNAIASAIMPHLASAFAASGNPIVSMR